MKSYTLIALILGSLWLSDSLTATSIDHLNLRFNHENYDFNSQELTVSIQIKSETSHLILAGQNYRLFYPSNLVRIIENESISQLDKSKFSALTLSESITQIDASEIGDIDFDQNLGFANITIDLEDLVNGGIALDSPNKWTSVATLRFKVLDTSKPIKIVWAREGLSDGYATAFVNVAKWNGPMSTTAVVVSEFQDYSISINDNEFLPSELTLSIYPNPTTDYVDVDFYQNIKSDSKLSIVDANGKEVKRIKLDSGISKVRVTLSELLTANYMINLLSNDDQIIKSEPLSVVR